MSKIANLIRPWDATEARAMLARGTSSTQIASYFGSTTTTIRCWLDPEYAAHCRQRINDRRREKAGIRPPRHTVAWARPPEADTMARLAEIPPDDRGLTARLMGDPLPGRSALHKRQAMPG
jgi:hypothetical protein